MGMGCDPGEGADTAATAAPRACCVALRPPYPKILTVSSAVDLSDGNITRGVSPPRDGPGTLKSRRDRENMPDTDDEVVDLFSYLYLHVNWA